MSLFMPKSSQKPFHMFGIAFNSGNIISQNCCNNITTLKIEELITGLSREYTIVIVTHNMQQAVRVSQYTGFFLLGRSLSWLQPLICLSMREVRDRDYISGRFD